MCHGVGAYLCFFLFQLQKREINVKEMEGEGGEGVGVSLLGVT